uniref:Uncharacterized protein n=1 Tax=Molossus molossus TaxID=27622 RepID=A0A7J8EEB2_MOLMO|nr:hypothetical protein HJG59_008789 [Molossus molossus]
MQARAGPLGCVLCDQEAPPPPPRTTALCSFLAAVPADIPSACHSLAAAPRPEHGAAPAAPHPRLEEVFLNTGSACVLWCTLKFWVSSQRKRNQKHPPQTRKELSCLPRNLHLKRLDISHRPAQGKMDLLWAGPLSPAGRLLPKPK